MKKRNDGVYHFDQGDYVDMGGTTVVGQRLGGYNPYDFVQSVLADLGSTAVSGVVDRYDPTARELLLGSTPSYGDVLNYITLGLDPRDPNFDLNKRQAEFDALLKEYNVLPPTGAPSLQSFLPPVNPVFIGQPNLNLPGDSGGKAPGEAAYASEQDAISQLQNIWGIDQAAAQQKYYDMIGKPVPAVSQSPVEPQFSAKDILDYLSQPGKTDIEIAQAMQSAGVSPAQVAQTTGMSEAEVQQRYNDALAAASGTTMTSPSGATTVPTLGTGTLNTVQGVLNNAGRVVGGAMDTLFDILGIPKPSYTVVQPRMPGGTVVWGQPSGSVFGRVGTTPGGTVVGVQTGIPVLDVLIGKAADIISGRVNANDAISAADIEKIIVETARGELGIPDLTDPQDIINKVVDLQKGVGADDSQSVIDLTKGPISAEADKTPSGEQPTFTQPSEPTSPPTGEQPKYTPDQIKEYIDTTYGQDGITDEEAFQIAQDAINAGVTPEQIAEATGVDVEDVLRYFETEVPVVGETQLPPDEVINVITGEGKTPPVPEIPVVPKVPAVTGVDTTSGRVVDSPTTTTPPRVPEVSTGAPTTTVPTPQLVQGLRGEATEKAGVVDLGELFSNPTLLEALIGILASEGDNTGTVPYYGGGRVYPAGNIDEIIRLIRG